MKKIRSGIGFVREDISGSTFESDGHYAIPMTSEESEAYQYDDVTAKVIADKMEAIGISAELV